MLHNFKKHLQEIISYSIRELYSSVDNFPDIEIDIPNDKQHGEFSCNIAMRLTKTLKKNPLVIAGEIREAVERKVSTSPLKDKIKAVEAKKPGFVNFYLTIPAFYDVLYQVFSQKENYGRCEVNQGEKIQIEFVSANPTGPLSVAHARQAVVGDALANILSFTGADVTKEYYVNDEGNQINILGASICHRALEELGQKASFPEDGYQGGYIKDMAQDFIARNKIKNIKDLKDKPLPLFAQFGVDYLLGVIKNDLKDFGVNFDVWSHQSEIANDKKVEEVLSLLEKKDFIYKKEGALWFKSTDFGDDKDRVVKKSDGSYTYLAPDIVYHKNKFDRGFTKVFNIWGPDHHGYIPRIKAAAQVLGRDPDDLCVLIVQLATIYRDGKPISMSTRRGQYISLREVIDEVGVDAARFFFLMRHIEVHLDFDLELAKKETPENPVYYIQYAHARINSIIQFAKEKKVIPKCSQFKLLQEEEELDLIKRIGSFTDILIVCARQSDPFALVNYLQDVATFFHRFYDKHRVVGEDDALSSERLALIDATKIVLASGLKLLGVSAPKKM